MIVCEVKTSPPQNFKVDIDEGTFEGLAAAYGNIDQGGDRLLFGSGKHIADANPTMPVYFGHGWMQNERPIGKSIYFEERPEGLFTKAKIFDTEAGREVLTGMREGVLGCLSIGWNPVDKKMVKEGKRTDREISKWDIKEYSVLPNGFAMNPQALITAVKDGRLTISMPEEEPAEEEDGVTEAKELELNGIVAIENGCYTSNNITLDAAGVTDLTDAHIPTKDYTKLRTFVEKSDPVAMLLDEATYLRELAVSLKAEGREEEVRQALAELDSASLILKALCAVKEVELPDESDLLALIRQTTKNIHEASQSLSS